nr:MAG TPA: hypothetical protein [Caudoviricetes sp.]
MISYCFYAKGCCRQAGHRRLNGQGKQYPLPEAGTRRGSGGAEAKEEKARSCTIARAPAVRIFYGRPMPQGLPFPLGFISHSLWRKESKGEKVRSYAVAHAPAG